MDNSFTTLDYQMSPAEKLSIAENVAAFMLPRANVIIDRNLHKIARAKKYPYFLHKDIITPYYGTWHMVLTFFEKCSKTIGISNVALDLYQEYEKWESKNLSNDGYGMFHIIVNCGATGIRLDEFTPHMFNRIIERYDDEVDYMEFQERAMFMKKLTLNSLLAVKDEVKNAHGYEYREFVVDVPAGQLLGRRYKEDERYFCTTTFISKNEMKSSQFVQNDVHAKLIQFKKDNLDKYAIGIRDRDCDSQLQKYYGKVVADEISRLLKTSDWKVRNSPAIRSIASSLSNR